MHIEYVLMNESARVPTKKHTGDVGWDLYASEDLILWPGQMANVYTGVRIAMPDNVWGLIKGRSSTWRKRGLIVVDGVIDNGYRGELAVGIFNPGFDMKKIKIGERLAQIIFLPMVPIVTESWKLVDELRPGDRGEAGYGSTGA